MSRLVLLLGLVVVGAVGCAPEWLLGPEWERESPLRSLASTNKVAGVERGPASLPDPPTPERVRLGRWLFHDARLSADRTVSCATCHRPDQAFAQVEAVSTGVHNRRGTRKAQPVLNLAWAPKPVFFWDGRVDSLESQALGPIANPNEMGLTVEEAVARIASIPGYTPYFREAFGDGRVTAGRLARAIADYERTLLSGDSAYDRWKNGDAGAMSAEAVRGEALFRGRAACARCHTGPDFTDGQFHNTGQGWNAATGTFADAGRFEATQVAADRGAFKTPTLRDVSKRGTLMHDGALKTLADVVEFYNRGGVANPGLSPKVFPLGLTREEVQALVAFLRALDSNLPEETSPASLPQ